MIKITKQLLSEWFKVANEKYFNGDIEKEPNYVITTNKSRYGQFRPRTWEIEISTAFVRSENAYKNTFLHELCHLYARQKHGAYIQSHGYEWKEIADRVTRFTKGKYGIIQRCGGYKEGTYLRENTKMNNFVVFTDYKNHLAIAKYSDIEYVMKLKRLKGVKENTTIYYFVSDDVRMATIPLRKSRARSISWNYVNYSLGEIKAMSKMIDSELYHPFNKAA